MADAPLLHFRWGLCPFLFGALLIVLIGLIAGCKSADTARRPPPVEVTVPVPTPAPALAIPERPALPLARVDSSASPRRVTRAYVRSVMLLQGYARQLEILLNAYRDSTRGRHVGDRR
jgi:hypothetical protein